MSLRFVFGPSGAGKSRLLYENLTKRSMEETERKFLVIVPDQFTMETQKDLVHFHERGGILNIDVLSFGRLSYRIFDEVGALGVPVLDDTGKSLVLQKVAIACKEQLPTLGGYLHRQGYIHEVKSAISEFMQYGIGVRDMEKLIDYAGKRGALVQKLKDLSVLYQGFKDYIQGSFVTTEGTLDVLRRSLGKSALVKDSVVVFDGFTGFTPIQNRVIQEIMGIAKETIVSLTLGEGEDPYHLDGEQRLFHMTKKTVADLERLSREAGVERGQDMFLKGSAKDRFCLSPALRSLEKNLFRYQVVPFKEKQDSIHLFEASTPREEVHQAGLLLMELIRKGGMAYRDIAFVAGDLESYAPYVESEFARLGIPVYIDRTRGIILNPMIEYIKSGLELYKEDFSYEAVFHYLRSGLSDITPEEADLLENYVLATGIRGYKRWSRLFTRKSESMGEAEEALLRINGIREKLMDQVKLLQGRTGESVADYVNHLYDFLVQNQVQQELSKLAQHFNEQNQPGRAREYAQIYGLVMELLDQIYGLLGEEPVKLEEFYEILNAGFGEIQVGTIPQNVDRVLVGDMERTRLKPVKVLFFLGVNDGNIPKNSSKGGIISDMDREFLKESDLELAPSPREQMFIQRFYLYLNLTKPSHKLYLSYCKVNSQGKSLRPAYLIEVMQKLFPVLETEYPQNRPFLEQVVTPTEGVGFLAEGLRNYVEGTSTGEAFLTLYAAYGEKEAWKAVRERLTNVAFLRYQGVNLSKAAARALYGLTLENSVSRLETYAACAYRHFLQYGLSLEEREEFGFESVDMGNVFHAVLESFAMMLKDSDYTWFDFPKEFGEKKVLEALEAYAAEYGETILYSNARNEYAITRMARVLTRTVLTLQSQLQKGEFQPDAVEKSFYYTDDLDSVNVALSEEEKMRLKGRIDRIDTAEDEEHVYVKVIDYKSGSRQFDLAALYYGLQLQLVVYMNAAMELEARKHPDKEVVPAALLYYHIEDPTVETPVELSEEELNEEILSKLRMKGVVNDSEAVVEKLDRFMGSKSDVIPVERKKDGSFSARSSVMSAKELRVMSDYVTEKVRCLGKEILEGKIGLSPYEMGNESACTYCAYKKVCGFDPSIPGYETRVFKSMDKEEAIKRMEAFGENA